MLCLKGRFRIIFHFAQAGPAFKYPPSNLFRMGAQSWTHHTVPYGQLSGWRCQRLVPGYDHAVLRDDKESAPRF